MNTIESILKEFKSSDEEHERYPGISFITKAYWKPLNDVKIVCNLNNRLNIHVIETSSIREDGEKHTAYKVQIRPETNDNLWVDFSYYSISEEEFAKKYYDIESRLIEAWLIINK